MYIYMYIMILKILYIYIILFKSFFLVNQLQVSDVDLWDKDP